MGFAAVAIRRRQLFFGLLIEKNRGTGACRAILAVSLAFNIGLPCVFKYMGFIIENINALFGAQIAVPNIPLPIGISFYTFQVISYIADLYWGKTEVQRSLLKFLAFITMFPQLIAGPIVRYSDIHEQLNRPDISLKTSAWALRSFLSGLAA